MYQIERQEHFIVRIFEMSYTEGCCLNKLKCESLPSKIQYKVYLFYYRTLYKFLNDMVNSHRFGIAMKWRFLIIKIGRVEKRY